jgi:hypothetical protein
VYLLERKKVSLRKLDCWASFLEGTNHASLLGTVTGGDAFIVFSYDNSDHLSACIVLGFRRQAGPRITRLAVCAYVYGAWELSLSAPHSLLIDGSAYMWSIY